MNHLYRQICTEPPSTQIGSDLLPVTLRRSLQERYLEDFDERTHAPRGTLQYVDLPGIEYSLYRAANGESFESLRARESLDAAQALLAPEGGVRAYASDNWATPSEQRTVRAQVSALRAWSLGWRVFRRDADRVCAEQVALHARELTAARTRAPEQHVYELASLAEALAWHHECCWSPASLQLARLAARQLISLQENMSLKIKRDQAVSFAQLIAISRAQLQLHRCTGSRSTLSHAVLAARTAVGYCRAPHAGFYRDSVNEQNADIDDLISACRQLNLLAHYLPAAFANAPAQHGMRFLSIPENALCRSSNSELLLLDEELRSAPQEIQVEGPRAHQQQELLLSRSGWFAKVSWCNQHSDAQLQTAAVLAKAAQTTNPAELAVQMS